MEFNVTQSSQGSHQIDFGGHRTTQGFYQLARRLENILQIHYTHKSDDFNTLRWKYAYDGVPFVLTHHWDSGTVISVDKRTPSADEESALDAIVALLKAY